MCSVDGNTESVCDISQCPSWETVCQLVSCAKPVQGTTTKTHAQGLSPCYWETNRKIAWKACWRAKVQCILTPSRTANLHECLFVFKRMCSLSYLCVNVCFTVCRCVLLYNVSSSILHCQITGVNTEITRFLIFVPVQGQRSLSPKAEY